ncbi:GRP family sugar transporter [Neobacillus terrae]|uniref:GRP family sugar transporter n=1 Tax=Neobacillus terrae TaxID=3034837 RepID=UPI0014088F40|nr:GRP family sugar transporter [Neobacillus terrae]NHM32622.1 glucose transporter GlcU [Neobacillus terrae]
MTGILLALIPAVCWGSIVLVSVKLGGDAYSQTFGITIGALIFSVVLYLFVHPHLSASIMIVGFLSGIFWAVGQRNQLGAVKYLGVSKTVPLSTGMQLVATTLFGVLVFKEWTTKTVIILGIIAILLIITGVIFTAIRDKDNAKENKGNTKKGIVVLLISTAGFLAYVLIIRWFNFNGWAVLLPQATGMMVGAFVLTYRHKPFNKYAVRNIITGLIWGAGNLGLLLSLPRIGVATSFSLSQTGIIISTLGGIFLLHEKKSKRQIIFVIIGCILVILGGVLLGFTKK